MKSKLNQPLVSIVMPVYNAGEFLVEALSGAINQTYKNWELIAVDDASSDSSLKILKNFAKKDNRITVLSNKKRLGVGGASNKALSYAKGKFIVRMDSDDVSLPNRLEDELKFLQNNPEVIVVGGSLTIIDARGKTTGVMEYPFNHKDIYKMLFSSIPVSQPAFMVNKALLPKDFVWYDGQATVAEEVELLFKLFKYGQGANIQKPVIYYRVHGKNTSLVNPKRTFYVTFFSRMRAIKKYGYRPTVKGLFISFVQLATVSLLPSVAIYPIYSFIRGAKNKIFNLSATKSVLQFAR